MQPLLFSQTTWKSPTFKPEPLRSVMVLAQVEDRSAKQQLEDFTVKFLTDKGIKAVSAYATLKRTKFATKEDFLAYTDSLGVDGLLVYAVEDAENSDFPRVKAPVECRSGQPTRLRPTCGAPRIR